MKHSKKSTISIAVVTLFVVFALMPGRLARVQSSGSQELQKGQYDQEPTPFGLQDRGRRKSTAGRSVRIEEPEKDDPFSRMRAEFAGRGRITAAAIESQLREAKRQRDDYSGRFAQGQGERNVPKWESLGPTSDEFIQNAVTLNEIDSGRLRTILPHPQDPDTVYVLSSGGGLWKSTNFRSANHRWRPLTDSVGTTAGGSVAMGSDPETLYLGTGDPFDAPGGFIVRSTNGGNTWSDPVILAGATKVMDVKVDSMALSNAKDSGDQGNSEVVLAGTDAGLFRSANGANSFAPVSTFVGTAVWSLVKTSAGWLASVQDMDPFGYFGFGPGSLYVSTDRGATWLPSTNLGNGFANAGRTTLAVGKTGDSVVYAFSATVGDNISGDVDQLDLFRSADGGQTWLPLYINGKTPTGANPWQTDMDLMSVQAWYNQLVLVDPTDPSRNTVYLGGQLATAKTTDAGNTWSLLSDWLPTYFPGDNLPYVHGDCHAAAFSLFAGKSTVFFGTDGGLSISTDGGTTWDNSKNRGLVDQLLYSLSASAVHPEQTLIGLQDLGTRFRVGDSTVWNQVFGGDGMGTGWSQRNDNASFCSVQFDRYAHCINNPPDQQSKWLWANFHFQPDYFTNFYTALATPSATLVQSGHLFVSYAPTFIYYTSSASARWNTLANINEGNGYGPSNINAGPPFTTFFRDVVHGLGMSDDSTAMGVCATGGKVVLSTDDQNTWNTISLNAEVPDTVSRLGFHSFTANVLWATNTDVYVTSINPAPGVTRVVRSTQGGASGTWTAAQTGLPDVPVNKLAADPHDRSRNTIFAATDLGVYRTTDRGAHWSLLGSDLPQVRVTDLYIPPDGSFLRIATYGRGVWEIGLSAER